MTTADGAARQGEGASELRALGLTVEMALVDVVADAIDSFLNRRLSLPSSCQVCPNTICDMAFPMMRPSNTIAELGPL